MNLRRLFYLSALSTLLTFGCGKKESPTEPAVNHAPTIESIVANPSKPYTGDVSDLECIADDSDNDHLYYDWTCDGGYFSDFNNEKIRWHTPGEAGLYHITVEVDDRREEGKILGNKSISVIAEFDTILVSENGWTKRDVPDFNSHSTFYYDDLMIYRLDLDGILDELYLKFDLPQDQNHIN